MPGPVLDPAPLQIEAVLAEIRANHPQLHAARSRVEAARERLPQAAAWEDPRVGVDIERRNRRLLSYNDAEWSVSQAIPVTGKIIHRKEAAAADVAVADAVIRQLDLEFEARARGNYFK